MIIREMIIIEIYVKAIVVYKIYIGKGYVYN